MKTSVFVVLSLWVGLVYGHGMVIEPPSRGTMWRFGYNTPINYNDNQNWCGGRPVQWDKNGGKCGECGDDYSLPRPRDNENTGKYGTGLVVHNYQSGQVIDTITKLTAAHKGFFQFRLCPLNTPDELETQECFDQHLLTLPNGDTQFPIPYFVPKNYQVSLVLPQGLTCERCVLQWTYTTGNSWGNCLNGTSALGCGPQETFRTCSDISIS